MPYPATLPAPDLAPFTPAELRDVQASGPFASAARSRDCYGTQDLTFTFTDEEAGVFWTWWETDLALGGRAFAADWPHPDGVATHVYRFLSVPRQEHLATTGVRRLTVQASVRGASLLPA